MTSPGQQTTDGAGSALTDPVGPDEIVAENALAAAPEQFEAAGSRRRGIVADRWSWLQRLRGSTRLSAAFPPDDPRPHTASARIWILVGLALGIGISIGRVENGLGVFNTIWAEDGTNFLTDALNRPILTTLVRPMNGYFNTLCRVLALPARFVPLDEGPVLLSTEAAVVTATLAILVYLASRTHLRTVLGRLVAAAPLVAVPIGENLGATTADNIATLQFGMIYATMWMLLWVPATRRLRIVAFAVVLVTALNTFLVVLLLPLALLRLMVRPDRLSRGMVGALVAGAGLNVLALATGRTARPSFLVPHYDPVWAVRHLADWGLPYAMFGYRITGSHLWFDGHLGWVAVVSALILIAVVAAPLIWRLDPQWTVAAIVTAEAVLMLCGSIMSAGRLEPRYVVMPELALYAAIALVLRPRPGQRRRWVSATPTVMLATFVLVVGIANYHLTSWRSVQTHPWPQLVAQAQIVCHNPAFGAVYVYPSAKGAIVGVRAGTRLPKQPPYNWPVLLPCDRLR